MLAVLRVIWVADVVKSLDEAVRVVLRERDTELDDLVGVGRASIDKPRRCVVATLVDVPSAANTSCRDQRHKCEGDERAREHDES
jgi:hypothetical protein